ncbi:MAG TPA: GNAT family N-acetyltransferase [Candidatus Limnocylindrales bacterium]|nr:GNAT family N-acetyltransferase [Candidatus Limnocylindrales bacterium]
MGERSPAPTIEIRPVTHDDLERLIDIYLDTAIHHAAIDPAWFQVPARDDVAVRLRRRIDGRGEDGEYVAAMLDRQMVGSATISVEDAPHPGSMMRPIRTAEFGVSVVDGHRGLGIGRALIGHLEGWAADHGVERIILNVAEANTGAIRLYHELGYVDYDRAMRKDIGPA